MRVIHSKCSGEISHCSTVRSFPLSSFSRLPQVIFILLLMEIPSDPNLVLDEFSLSHVTIILAFNPVYRKQGRTERNKIEISRIMTESKSPPKWEKLNSLLTSVTEGLFKYLTAFYLSLSQCSGSSSLIKLWVIVMLPKSAWQFLSVLM